MGNETNPKQLTGSATTTIGSVRMMGIGVNKTLTGTMTVKEGANTVAVFAIGTTPGTYHAIPSGVRYSSLSIVLSAGDDVTAFCAVA